MFCAFISFTVYVLCVCFRSEEARYIFVKQNYVDFDFYITYSFLCLYTYSALLSKTPELIRLCNIQYSEN